MAPCWPFNDIIFKYKNPNSCFIPRSRILCKKIFLSDKIVWHLDGFLVASGTRPKPLAVLGSVFVSSKRCVKCETSKKIAKYQFLR